MMEYISDRGIYLMENGSKYYKKALKHYYDGEIHKAVIFCGKCLNINPKHSAALSLQGLLLYFQGNLKEARKLWERNYKINGDEVAKKYLVDSRNDFEMMDIFDEAIEKMRAMDITLAIKLFLHCKKSDFNSLNVNIKLMECYMKKGEYEKLQELISEHKIIDKNNKTVRNLEKELIKLGIKQKESKKDLIMKTSILAGIGIVVLFLGKSALNIINYEGKGSTKPGVESKGNETGDNENTNKTGEEDNTVDDTTDVKDNVKEEEKEAPETFTKEKVMALIDNKKIDELSELVKKYDKDQLDANQKVLFKKAENTLKREAVLYYVEKGKKLRNNDDYVGAMKEFEKGMEYVDYSRKADEGLIFWLAQLSIEMESVENTIKYTDILKEKYPDGDYVAEILFQSAKFLEEEDLNKAKEYARIIEKDFADSIYMNDIVKRILTK